MKLPVLALVGILSLNVVAENDPATNIPGQRWHPKAPPLPAATTGKVVRAANSEELYRLLETASPHSTVLVADGHYHLSRTLQIRADGVTLRGETGIRDRVVLDGGGTLGEGIRITQCKGATVADLTLENIRWNGIKLDSDTGVQQVIIYNCVLHNIWQRGIKGVAVPKERRDSASPSDCVIRYCLFYNDRPKAYSDDADDNPKNYQGNYIAGIDAMFVRSWTISDNVFVGIQGRTQEGRGAIFLWQDSRDCLIERNILLNCDCGISLGNLQRSEPDQIHCTRFTVRNNFLTRVPENGIFVVYSRDCMVIHNTIYDPESRRGRLIRILGDHADLRITNNLLIGPAISNQSGAPLALDTNVIERKLDLVDSSTGNLRLTRSAVAALDRCVLLRDADQDIDGNARGKTTDAGAHEFDAIAR